VRKKGVKLSDESYDVRWCKTEMAGEEEAAWAGQGRAGSVELGHGRLRSWGCSSTASQRLVDKKSRHIQEPAASRPPTDPSHQLNCLSTGHPYPS
jgi:hypothetical protein